MSLWDGRFKTKADNALVEFTESISFDKRLYKHDIRGSIAHAKMLAKSGIISEKSKEKIVAALKQIELNIENNEFEFTPELEDIHMHIENALIDKIGDDGAMLHAGRSRNDQIALDMRLYLREEIINVVEKIKNFQRALLEQANSNISTILPGYTHLQRAQPVLFAHHLLAYAEMFERDIGRLMDCRKRLNVMPLGSGALAGTTLPIQREKVAELLDFSEISRNSMDAVADRDFACELLASFSIFAMHVSRLSEDIILWCSAEFDFIELDDAFCTGSSIMPQKKNPDAAELGRGKTARIFGDLMALLALLKGLPMTYNRDLQEDKELVFDAIDTVKKILSVYPLMIFSMKTKKKKMQEAASDPMLMATDLAEELVNVGIPFRVAHHNAGSLIKWCEENNRSLNSITLDEMKISIPQAKESFLKLFNPENSVVKRNLFGATAINQVKKQIIYWNNKLGLT